jgi:hypothetical protein
VLVLVKRDNLVFDLLLSLGTTFQNYTSGILRAGVRTTEGDFWLRVRCTMLRP